VWDGTKFEFSRSRDLTLETSASVEAREGQKWLSP